MTKIGTYIEPFDFQTVLVNYFLGTMELFIFAFVIITSFACAKYGMGNKLFLTLLAIGSIIFAIVLGEAIYILVILIIGIVTFKGVARLTQ